MGEYKRVNIEQIATHASLVDTLLDDIKSQRYGHLTFYCSKQSRWDKIRDRKPGFIANSETKRYFDLIPPVGSLVAVGVVKVSTRSFESKIDIEGWLKAEGYEC